MGLDIYLFKIIAYPKSKAVWFSEDEYPKLKINYSNLITTRDIELGDGTIINEKGFYFDEISYQRKGVNPIFFKKFAADDFIFTYDRFLELKSCIKKNYKNSFKEDFIEKFKEKENFIFVDY